MQKDLRLQKADIQTQVTPAAGGCTITVGADKFVRALCLSVDDDNSRWSNNYIDLLPGVTRSIFVSTTLSADEVKRTLTLQSLNDLHE